MDKTTYDRGLKIRKSVLGDEFVDVHPSPSGESEGQHRDGHGQEKSIDELNGLERLGHCTTPDRASGAACLAHLLEAAKTHEYSRHGV